MKNFFLLVTFIVLGQILSIEATFAQQSCQGLFQKDIPVRKSKLLTREQYAEKKLESMDDFREVYVNEDVRIQIRSRDLFLDHAPELLPSLRSVIDTLNTKLERMSADPLYEKHAAFLYLKHVIPQQVGRVLQIVKLGNLSYMNYLRNGFSLLSSLNHLSLIESQTKHLSMTYFAQSISGQLRVNIAFARSSEHLDSVPEHIQHQLRVKDISSLRMNDLLAEMTVFGDILSAFPSAITQLKIGNDLFLFYGRPTKSSEDIYKINEEDFIKMDGKDVYVIEAIDQVVNPHGAFWSSLGHANHDLFHANQMMLGHRQLRFHSLREDWFTLRDRLYGTILLKKDLEQRKELIDLLYELIHENPDLMDSFARYQLRIRSGQEPEDALAALRVELSPVRQVQYQKLIDLLWK